MRLNERNRRTVAPFADGCDCGDEDCDAGSSSTLFPHDFNVMHHFRVEIVPESVHDSPLLFGVELELEIARGGVFDVLDRLFETHPHFIAKRDGSLSDGVELVTLPLTFEQHERLAHDMKATYFPLMAARSTCGMHVHVDRRVLRTDKMMRRFVGFFSGHGETPHAASWQDFLTVLCRRVDNRYCKREATSDRLFERSMSDRYCAVNLSNGSTIEVRAFAATRNVGVYLANIELVAAVIAGAESGLCDDWLKPEDFMASILHADAVKLFPHLAARLSKPVAASGKTLFEQWLKPADVVAQVPPLPTAPEEIFKSNLPHLTQLPATAQLLLGITQQEESPIACA